MTDLPSGTVTFLFTDIEGSTKLWEAYPDQMREAVARHDALLRQAVEQNTGAVIKTTGDGLCAAFTVARDALEAALLAQCTLLAEPLPDDTPIRSRMGLHTGTAELRDGDYYGTTLNRCARLMAAGHGGQTLLSMATQELVRDTLPNAVTLLDLGSHRLKDMERPEHVFQLTHPALPQTFAPLRTLDSTPNNLPLQLTSFIGREADLTEVRGLLGKTRLLTLTASGGSGKTRLSLQVAADVLDSYADGTWQIELAPLADPTLVPQTVATVLGVKEQAGQSITQTLTGYLKDKTLLLILDNCEHVLAACASFVTALLRSCPGVRVLATSREPLGIGGETTYRVPSLSLPTRQQTRSATVESVSQFEAVRLFIERAQAVKPDFTVTNQNAPALAQLCFRLDGIPLAIELAAARVRSLAVEQINDKLDSRFRLLTGGDKSALPRQQTLRALVDWSYDLLTDGEKALLARLSVFAGGWTLEAAENVCGFDPIAEWEVLDLLTSLVDKSLILSEELTGEQATRYRMLETIRQYSAERVSSSGEEEEALKRHVAFFVALAEEAEPTMWGPDQVEWLNRLETEHDNLRASLNACAVRGLDAPTAALSGLQLSGALGRFWRVRGHLTEGQAHLGRALALRQAAASGVADRLIVQKAVARALDSAGLLASDQGDHDWVRSHYSESLTISREIGDKRRIAYALGGLGYAAFAQGDYDSAKSQHGEGLSLFREIGDQGGIAYVLSALGHVAMTEGDYVSARSLYEERLRVSREVGDKGGIAYVLTNLGGLASVQGDYVSAQSLFAEGLSASREIGNKFFVTGIALGGLGYVAYAQGDYVSARSQFEEGLSLSREIGGKLGVAHALENLGRVSTAQGDFDSARSLFRESLSFSREGGSKRGIAYGLEGIAAVSVGEGHWHLAVVLTASAAALRESIAAPRFPNEQAELDASVAKARAALSSTEFDAARVEGAAMPWEQAVELALVSAPKGR